MEHYKQTSWIVLGRIGRLEIVSAYDGLQFKTEAFQISSADDLIDLCNALRAIILEIKQDGEK